MAQPTKPQHQHQRRHFGQQRKQMFFETVASSPLQVYIFYIGIARYFLKTFRFLSLNCWLKSSSQKIVILIGVVYGIASKF